MEDPYVYPPSTIIARLRQLLDRGGHPLESHFSFHALLGFLPLPKYHLLIVNKKHKVGSIAQRWVYGISEWTLYPLQYRAKGAGVGVGGGGGGRTSKYRELIDGYIDLSKDFFFSYYYDLTHSLQHNLTVGARDSGNGSGKERRESDREGERTVLMDETKQKEAANDNLREEPSSASVTLGVSSSTNSMVQSISMPVFPSRSTDASSLSSNSSPLTDSESTSSEVNGSPSQSTSDMRSTTPLSLPDGSNPWADLNTSFAAAANAPAASASPLASPRSTNPSSSPLTGSASPTTRSTPYLPPLPPRVSAYADQWLWNFYPAHSLLSSLPLSSYWLVPLIHGFFQQQLLRAGHLDLLVTLMARRSRHYAGTRYIKRGIEARGHVANEVESEQIIECIDRGSAWFSNNTSYSSVVILRGSIPLYWWQENVHTMKPNVVIASDQENYTATRAHFDDLRRRYGDKIDILSLIKKEEKNPQEVRLGYAYTAAVATLREGYKAEESVKLEYQTYDFLNMRHAKANVLRDVRNLVAPAVEAQGVFSHVNVIETEEEREGVESASDLLRRERRHVACSRQSGVVRINCVDCLDRTNVAMFCVGKAAMKRQLQLLGLLGPKGEKVWPELVLVLQRFYTMHGDRIAQQYAGSGAMHREALYDKGGAEDDVDALDNNDLISGPSGGVGQATRDRLTDEHNRDVAAEREKERTAAPTAERAPKQKVGAGMAHNAISFAKRYYSNNVTDVEKQQAINVFLGHFIPPADPRSKQVWDMDPAAALHEFDQRLAARNNEPLFYPPYNPNCLVPVTLLKKRAPATAASPVAAAEGASEAAAVDGGGGTQLGQLFNRFFDEKYNPTKLTSLEKELSKQYARPLYVGQPLLEVKETKEKDKESKENKTPVSVGSNGSVEPSPLIGSMSGSYSSSSNVPSLPLLDETDVGAGPMSPSSPRSRLDSGTFELGPNARMSPAPMYNTPPHSPSPHSLSRHNSIDQPSPSHTASPPSPLYSLPPPSLPIATPVGSNSGDAFSFNLTSGVVTAPHPGHKTGLAQANAVANKVGAATKSFFTKGLKSAFGAKAGGLYTGVGGAAGGSAGAVAGADKHLHRVRSSGNVHAGGGGPLALPVAAPAPSLSVSRSAEFNFLDAGTAVTLAHAHAAATSNSFGPMSPTGTNSPRKGLPPTHGNLPSSSSFTGATTRNNMSPIAAIPKDLSTGLTAFQDLLGGVNLAQPFLHGQDSPKQAKASKGEAEEKVSRPQTPLAVTISGAGMDSEEGSMPSTLTIAPTISAQMYEDRVFVPRNDEELFHAYVDTERLCQLAHNTTPWTDTWQLQVATSPKRDTLSPRATLLSPLSATSNGPQQPSSPLLLTSRSISSTGPSATPTFTTTPQIVSSVSQQLASELSGDDVPLVTSTIPSAVDGVRSVEENQQLEAAGVDALAVSTEVPGQSDDAAVAKLAGEIE